MPNSGGPVKGLSKGELVVSEGMGSCCALLVTSFDDLFMSFDCLLRYLGVIPWTYCALRVFTLSIVFMQVLDRTVLANEMVVSLSQMRSPVERVVSAFVSGAHSPPCALSSQVR